MKKEPRLSRITEEIFARFRRKSRRPTVLFVEPAIDLEMLAGIADHFWEANRYPSSSFAMLRVAILLGDLKVVSGTLGSDGRPHHQTLVKCADFAVWAERDSEPHQRELFGPVSVIWRRERDEPEPGTTEQETAAPGNWARIRRKRKRDAAADLKREALHTRWRDFRDQQLRKKQRPISHIARMIAKQPLGEGKSEHTIRGVIGEKRPDIEIKK